MALHPGVVQTDLARYIVGGLEAGDTRMSETAAPPSGLGKAFKEKLLDKVILPVEKGANTQVFLAAGADNPARALAQKPKGVYYDVMKPASATAAATDTATAKRLWEISERLTAVKVGI